ncbi:MAG: phosphoglucosamine mutase, partial [Caulobacteraceae bacterium]
VMSQTGQKMSALARQFEPAPQKLENVRISGGKPLEAKKVQAAIAEAEARLNGSGRVVVRASGTEPLIRIMAEGDDEKLLGQLIKDIAGAVREAAA